MISQILLENSLTDGELLEDGGGVLLLESSLSTNTIDLFISSINIFSSFVDLFINGFNIQNNNINFFLYGKNIEFQNQIFFINGKNEQIENIYLFIYGLEQKNNIIDLIIIGKEINNNQIELFINGFDSKNQHINLFISSLNVLSNTIDLFINGPVFINNYLSVATRGFEINNNNIDIFCHAHETILNQIHLLIHGSQYYYNTIELFLHGKSAKAQDTTLFISGPILINEDVYLFIKGIQVPQPAICPVLDSTASIQISDDLIQIYQSRIDALINQLGKNILLEFNPIREPCTNCFFDVVSGRSNGVYKTGGPIPFTRGQKCPFCKGVGFLEIAVEKCIKVLIQWNPSDAQKYGISVDDPSSIVRFKGFLTDGDDMARAKSAISNHDIESTMKLRVKLIRGPIAVGLRESRYCISFWTLLDS